MKSVEGRFSISDSDKNVILVLPKMRAVELQGQHNDIPPLTTAKFLLNS